MTSHNHQVLDEQGIVAFGLDFDGFDIMVFRSRVHFHAYYDAVPGAVTLEADAPGMGPADLSAFEYRHIPADVFPVGRHWQEQQGEQQGGDGGPMRPAYLRKNAQIARTQLHVIAQVVEQT